MNWQVLQIYEVYISIMNTDHLFYPSSIQQIMKCSVPPGSIQQVHTKSTLLMLRKNYSLELLKQCRLEINIQCYQKFFYKYQESVDIILNKLESRWKLHTTHFLVHTGYFILCHFQLPSVIVHYTIY